MRIEWRELSLAERTEWWAAGGRSEEGRLYLAHDCEEDGWIFLCVYDVFCVWRMNEV